MKRQLIFPNEKFETLDYNGFSCRVWKDVPYCAAPVDDIQRLHLYAPACYYEDGSINGYTLKTAPIFLPNTVGGYMPGEPAEAGFDQNGYPNTVLQALMHGYVVACAGIRGRSTKNNAGKAPALIVDMKAAIRYLRHNAEVIPGDTERMATKLIWTLSAQRRSATISSPPTATVPSSIWKMPTRPMSGSSARSALITGGTVRAN